MSLEDELEELDNQLQKYTDELKEKDEKEALINAQIASLRLELAGLRDERLSVKHKIRKTTYDKESVSRKLELEREAALIEKSIAEKRKEAEILLASAPWYDPNYIEENKAFKWQVEGMITMPERGLLGDKRGLGKTLSSLIWRRLQGAKKVLVCLRKEVAPAFIREVNYREPGLFVYPMIGANAEARKIAAMLLNHQEEFMVVTNIESWRRDVENTTDDILKINYDAVILDEAHHIKNSRTGTAQGFFRIAETIPKVLELTGTPIKNRPQEMFSLLHALYPNLFPKESQFLWDYCISTGQNKWTFTPSGVVNLVKKIDSFYIARSPEDVGRKVPPPNMIEYKLSFDNHTQQREAYKLMTERSMAVLNSGKVIPIVSQLAIMTRQAQTVSWPAGIKFTDPETEELIRFDIHESVKVDWAEEFIQELVEEGERVVLFSRFKPAIYEIKKRLETAGLPVAVITGDEKGKSNTDEIFEDFDLKTAPKNPKFPVLLATYQTVGESANFNAARHMVLFDRFWNPGNDDQAIGRIDRINSTHQATVHLPYVENSIDEYMIKLIEDKRNMVMDFRDASEQQASLLEHLRNSL